MRVVGMGVVYCDLCGLRMRNGFCLHGTVKATLDAAYAAGMMFGGDALWDRRIVRTAP